MSRKNFQDSIGRCDSNEDPFGHKRVLIPSVRREDAEKIFDKLEIAKQISLSELDNNKKNSKIHSFSFVGKLSKYIFLFFTFPPYFLFFQIPKWLIIDLSPKIFYGIKKIIHQISIPLGKVVFFIANPIEFIKKKFCFLHFDKLLKIFFGIREKINQGLRLSKQAVIKLVKKNIYNPIKKIGKTTKNYFLAIWNRIMLPIAIPLQKTFNSISRLIHAGKNFVNHFVQPMFSKLLAIVKSPKPQHAVSEFIKKAPKTITKLTIQIVQSAKLITKPILNFLKSPRKTINLIFDHLKQGIRKIIILRLSKLNEKRKLILEKVFQKIKKSGEKVGYVVIKAVTKVISPIVKGVWIPFIEWSKSLLKSFKVRVGQTGDFAKKMPNNLVKVIARTISITQYKIFDLFSQIFTLLKKFLHEFKKSLKFFLLKFRAFSAVLVYYVFIRLKKSLQWFRQLLVWLRIQLIDGIQLFREIANEFEKRLPFRD